MASVVSMSFYVWFGMCSSVLILDTLCGSIESSGEALRSWISLFAWSTEFYDTICGRSFGTVSICSAGTACSTFYSFSSCFSTFATSRIVASLDSDAWVFSRLSFSAGGSGFCLI